MKWYFRIVMFLLEITLVNSWVLYNDTQKKKEKDPMSFYVYRKNIGKGLLKEFAGHRKPINTPKKVPRSKPSAEHAGLWGLCHIGKGTKRNCSLCGLHTTTFTCEECDNIPLCVIPCYSLHSHGLPYKE